MFDKAGVSYKRYVREFKLEGEYTVKDEIKAEIFEAGDKVDATAIAKAEGFDRPQIFIAEDISHFERR